MGNPVVQEQLKAVSTLLPQHEDLQDSLMLQEKILQVQLELDSSPTKGTTINWEDQKNVETLWQKACTKKKPIIHFLDPTVFDHDVLFPLSKNIIQILLGRKAGDKGLKKLFDSLESGGLKLPDLIKATLKENFDYIRKVAREYDIQPALLLFIVGALIQPCFEEITRKIDSSTFDRWWQASCPVCGRIPAVAKLRQRKRYLVCTFCGAEYLSDHYLCVHCENKDPYTLNFMTAEEQPAFHIDFCMKCKHYIKVMDEGKLKKPIPKGFEDLLTLDLDLSAKNAGLIKDLDY
ncbi:MAG: formate dehydrogenase accessory protein FdhE [Candidatus Bathyarchaeota archaeon]|nr:MAG: formate dehydrogenase accessory protein FdhE [Candidatus Bathyarchaeota archaeon]